MGMRADLIREMSPQIRKLFYNDSHYCRDVETRKYDRYIADNPDNVKALEDAMTNKGITLVVAPTGSGKSRTLADVAKKVVKQDKDCKVFIALPTVNTVQQTGNIPDVRAMVGGDMFYTSKKITATTYEKLDKVQDYIRKQKALGVKERYVLILDECHFLVTQHKFREYAMKGIISGIEQNFYDSAILLTATPAPMPLFRCDKCIEFESDSYRPVMDRIEIEFVDDVVEYIKGIDLDQCFPFVRLNSTTLIGDLVKNYLPSYGVLTSGEKDSDLYNSIVDRETIQSSPLKGILTTSVSEVGINVTSYPSNLQMIAAFPDWNMSVDSIEQFFNRARRTVTSHIECAKVILPKPKANEAYLLDGEGNKICEFHNVVLENGMAVIKDTAQMDGIPCGKYKVKLDLYGGKVIRNLYIRSTENSGEATYGMDSQPVFFNGAGFSPLIGILKSNYRAAKEVTATLQRYADAFAKVRDENQRTGNLTDDEMEGLELDDNELMEIMALAGIEAQKRLKDCLKYEDGEIRVDYRLLYMVSYDQYQRQYLYHADRLKEELEARMKVRVDFVETATGKEKRDYDRNNLWEGLEYVRQEVVCEEAYYDAIVKWEENKYTLPTSHHSGNIARIRRTGYLAELMKSLEKLHMSKENILRVMVSSKSKGKVTKYKNAYNLIISNKMLEKFDGMDASAIPLYHKGIKDTLQVAVYCYLKQKGCGCYTITDALAGEIIRFYKEAYPKESLSLNEKGAVTRVKKMLKNMYKSKGADVIRSQLKTDEKDIFTIEKSDFR